MAGAVWTVKKAAEADPGRPWTGAKAPKGGFSTGEVFGMVLDREIRRLKFGEGRGREGRDA